MKFKLLILCLFFVTSAYAANDVAMRFPSGTPMTVYTPANPPVGYVATPVNPTDTCIAGQYSFDADYFYGCRATNTWERAAIATWSVTNYFFLLESSDFLLLENGTDKLILN